MKKTYIKPAIQVMNTGIEGAIMQGASNIVNYTNDSKNNIKVNNGDDTTLEADAKHYNAWETWDE